MADSIQVKIKNFAAFKGRQDVKNNSWFRCSNRLLEDPDFFDFNHAEIMVWIYILSLASIKNNAAIIINFSHADRVCRLPKEVVLSAVKKLEGNQLLPVDVTRAARGRVANNHSTCATDRQTDTTDTTDMEPIPPGSATKFNPVKFYCDLWKLKNGKSPDIRPKESGQLTKLVKDVGEKRATEIMQAYFSMPDPMFMKRGYDVGTMLLNLTAISQFEVHGKVVTSEFVRQVEKEVDKAQNTKRRRSIEELDLEREAMMRESQLNLLVGGKS